MSLPGIRQVSVHDARGTLGCGGGFKAGFSCDVESEIFSIFHAGKQHEKQELLPRRIESLFHYLAQGNGVSSYLGAIHV